MEIYQRVLLSLVHMGLLNRDDAVLVVEGGEHDRQMMHASGLTNVTISNLEYHAGQTGYAPYKWRRLDGEHLEVDDNSFDWAVVHAGLHHMAIPARGVCEMFRVARKGILCFESRDSALMRMAIRIGLADEYELQPAFLTDGAVGGYRDGPIPNFVYRWTEREFQKTIRSFAPTHQHAFFYHYGYRPPWQRFELARSPVRRFIGRALTNSSRVMQVVLPKQGNQFVFGALKNQKLQPWLDASLRFNVRYLSDKYDKSRHRGATSGDAQHRLHRGASVP